MADFVLLGKSLPSTDSQGVMTQGIGFPLRDVDPGTPAAVAAQDVSFSNPTHPAIDNVGSALQFLIAVSRETSAVFTKGVAIQNQFLQLGGINSDDAGYVNVGTSIITRVTIARSDSDLATLEFRLNGNVITEFDTNQTVFVSNPMVIPMQNGEMLSVNVKDNSNNMSNVICTATVNRIS